MAERGHNLREMLILAGINEINSNGVTKFSVRRVAEACNVSCAAPYKHFKDKQDFIAAIIEYVNRQWQSMQEKILARCGDDLRKQIVEICSSYVYFLMDKPYYRAILMLNDEGYNNLYHGTSQQESIARKLMWQYYNEAGLDIATMRRKTQLVRSMIFGSIFLFNSGEIPFTEEAMEHLRYIIDREFDLP